MRNILRTMAVVAAMAAAVAVTAAPAVAEAQVSFDLKAAYAIPVGNVWQSSPWNPAYSMSNAWSGAVPFELALRYRINPNYSFGAYGQFGPAFTGSGSFGFPGTSGTDLRVGLEIVYVFAPDAPSTVWFSLGSGWEWTRYAATGTSVTVNGWEFLNFQLGLDFNTSKAFSFGPFVGFFMGTYSNIVSSPDPAYGGQVPTEARAFHGWFQLGMKGTLNL